MITKLARDRGCTLGDVSVEMEGRKYYAAGEAMQVLVGELPSCPMLCPLLTDILNLNEVEERLLHNALMDDGNRWWRVLRVASYEDAC